MNIEMKEGCLIDEQAYVYLTDLSKKTDAISCVKTDGHYQIGVKQAKSPEVIKVKNFMVQHFQETIEDSSSCGATKFTYQHDIRVTGQAIDGKKFTIKTRLFLDEGHYNCDMIKLKWA